MLVTSLQQIHNWTAKHDRNKMSFWHDVLLLEYDVDGRQEETTTEDSNFDVDLARRQVQNWIVRNSRLCEPARKLLREYAASPNTSAPGPMPLISPLRWNWSSDGKTASHPDEPDSTEKITPMWIEDETDLFKRDKLYGRVSREIDSWWLRARDANYEDWVVQVSTVQEAEQRAQQAYDLLNGFNKSISEGANPAALGQSNDHDDYEGADDIDNGRGGTDYVDYSLDEDDDGDSFGEGPLPGLLTEIPNVLDPKQIEALHMIVKSCILDTAGSGLTRAGENLQKTRCRMFLAMVCGRSLLREMLVFIAVWEKDEKSLIFQITTQIVEAIHHSALIPFAWKSLRIPKDIVSPAQTVLLRLVNHMFRARVGNPPAADSRESLRDIKLVQFFFDVFRTRVVPECIALMRQQGDIREHNRDPADFPVDSWDMERAKDGLAQYLEFLTTVSELLDTRAKLIEWEAVYDLIGLLNGLEVGVPKKPLVEVPKRTPQQQPSDPAESASTPQVERPYATDLDHGTASTPPPHIQEPAHKFTWAGVKGQIFTIVATLLQPPPGRSSPGNPTVQDQMVKFNGIVPLLNCCTYDDHNPYAKERVTLCLKWLLDGCEAANNFFRELVSLMPPPPPPPPNSPGPGTHYGGGGSAGEARHHDEDGNEKIHTLRVDGIDGEIRVKVRSKSTPADQKAGGSGGAGARTTKSDDPLLDFLGETARLNIGGGGGGAHGGYVRHLLDEDDDFM